MSDRTRIGARLPAKLITRIERHARRMKAALGGRVEVSLTDAIRDLLGRALDLVEAEAREEVES